LKNGVKKYSIPSRETIFRRIKAKVYLAKKCPYLPCHENLEVCNTCYCVFYPCEDENRGEYILSRKGTKVFSCMHCSWVHQKSTLEKVREFILFLENQNLKPAEIKPADLYKEFCGYIDTKSIVE